MMNQRANACDANINHTAVAFRFNLFYFNIERIGGNKAGSLFVE